MKDFRKQAASQSSEALLQNIMQNIPQFAENTDITDQYTDSLLYALNNSIEAANNYDELIKLQDQVDEALEKLENVEYAIKSIRSTIERKAEQLFDERFAKLS